MSDEKVPDTTQTSGENVQNVHLFDCTPEKDGGVLKEIITPGVGEDTPLAGDKVKVHYIGTLTDGNMFDSSRDRDEHFEFTIGKGEVIKAWDLGVATMKKGEKSILTCTPEYAYGDAGAGEKIPPKATLLFEVELFDWKGEDISPKGNEGTIIRRILTQGDGYKTPADGNVVDVHIIGKFEDRVFEDREIQFTVGEACEEKVIDGIDQGIRKFKKGEKSRLMIESSMAYGSAGNEEFKIPAGADLVYEVELKNMEKTLKEAWEMTTPEKLEQSELVKSKGTNYFKAGKYQLAIKQYIKITDYLEQSVKDMDNIQKDKGNALLVAAYLNMAMCYLKMDIYHETATNCDKALELDENNVKGLFRRGQARYAMKDYDGADRDYTKALTFDPENQAVKSKAAMARRKVKEFKDNEKKKYFGMFSKFAEMDSKEKGKNTPYHVQSDEKDKKADVMENVEEWQNKMADGMMSLEQEAEAFGEEVKPKSETQNGESNVELTEDGDIVDH